MKYIITIILFAIVSNGFGQLSVKWQTAATPYRWKYGTYDDVLKIPYGATAQMKDLGAEASRPGALFYRTTDEMLMAWNGFEFKPVAVAPEAIDKYQYATNTDVTVGDTTTVIVLNDDGDNTANRNITLKSPSAGKSLKILNYNSGIYSNVLTTGILGSDGILFSVLKQPATYTLISDGGMWRVLAVSEDVEGGGGGSGGGNSSGAIVTWD